MVHAHLFSDTAVAVCASRLGYFLLWWYACEYFINSFLLHVPRELISPDALVRASLRYKITKADIEQARTQAIQQTVKTNPL